MMRGVVDVGVSEVAHADRMVLARIGRLLEGLACPTGTASGAPAAKAASGTRPRLQLGMAVDRARGPCVSAATGARPVLTKLLAGFVRHHVLWIKCESSVNHIADYSDGGLWGQGK